MRAGGRALLVASGTGMDATLRVAWSYPQIIPGPHTPPKEMLED